ncbi:hypothetical protein ACH9L7_20255 (plasmid) [Haloferax sp. S1W]|uniref:hypothetical protein n=1 Tax=Haloferax sp. S1W TaxID=3377110 RepID=UPI0037CB27A8
MRRFAIRLRNRIEENRLLGGVFLSAGYYLIYTYVAWLFVLCAGAILLLFVSLFVQPYPLLQTLVGETASITFDKLFPIFWLTVILGFVALDIVLAYSGIIYLLTAVAFIGQFANRPVKTIQMRRKGSLIDDSHTLVKWVGTNAVVLYLTSVVPIIMTAGIFINALPVFGYDDISERIMTMHNPFFNGVTSESVGIIYVSLFGMYLLTSTVVWLRDLLKGLSQKVRSLS